MSEATSGIRKPEEVQTPKIVFAVGNLRIAEMDANYRQSMDFANKPEGGRSAFTREDYDKLSDLQNEELARFLIKHHKNKEGDEGRVRDDYDWFYLGDKMRVDDFGDPYLSIVCPSWSGLFATPSSRSDTQNAVAPLVAYYTETSADYRFNPIEELKRSGPSPR